MESRCFPQRYIQICRRMAYHFLQTVWSIWMLWNMIWYKNTLPFHLAPRIHQKLRSLVTIQIPYVPQNPIRRTFAAHYYFLPAINKLSYRVRTHNLIFLKSQHEKHASESKIIYNQDPLLPFIRYTIYYTIFPQNDDFWWALINNRICRNPRKTGAYGTLWNKSERTLHCQEVSANYFIKILQTQCLWGFACP